MLSKIAVYSNSINLEELIYHPLLKSIAVSLIIFLAFLLVKNVFTNYFFKCLLKLTSRTSIDEKILLAFEKPFKCLFMATGIYLAFRYLPLSIAADDLIFRLFRTLIIIVITWGLYALSDTDLSEEIKAKLNIDEILLSFFSKIFRFVVISIGLLVIAEEWNYNVSGLIAGLGIGGLAFALAAKDVLANIFAGAVIIMEKPFSIGDWIVTPSVEGTVEDITFRSTRVRAFTQSVITVPNSTLANEPITNYSRMGKRRITFHLGVTYDTPRNKLEKVVNDLKQMLIDHPDIHPETVFVNFELFSDSSLDIFLYFFTNTTNWGEFLAIRQDVNFKIMEILEREEVSIAFPSRSLYFNNIPGISNDIDQSEANI